MSRRRCVFTRLQLDSPFLVKPKVATDRQEGSRHEEGVEALASQINLCKTAWQSMS